LGPLYGCNVARKERSRGNRDRFPPDIVSSSETHWRRRKGADARGPEVSELREKGRGEESTWLGWLGLRGELGWEKKETGQRGEGEERAQGGEAGPRPIGPPGREQVALFLFFLFNFPNPLSQKSFGRTVKDINKNSNSQKYYALA